MTGDVLVFVASVSRSIVKNLYLFLPEFDIRYTVGIVKYSSQFLSC